MPNTNEPVLTQEITDKDMTAKSVDNIIQLPVPQVLEQPIVVVQPILKQPEQPPIIEPKLDKRDAITKAIDSNPCPTCRNKKIGHCECLALEEAALPKLIQVEPKSVSEDDLECEECEEELETRQELAEQAQMQQYAKVRLEPLTERTLHPATIALFLDLLDRGVLNVEHKSEDGVLNFSYQYQPDHKPGDREKFNLLMEFLLGELAIFQRLHNIRCNCAMTNRDMNGSIMSLNINFPHPSHYDRFILLLPMIRQEQQEKRKAMSQRELDRMLNLSPLATRLTRAATAQLVDEEDEEEQQYYSPLRPRSPRDRLKLKPNGYK
jgi:hypothetical protein